MWSGVALRFLLFVCFALFFCLSCATARIPEKYRLSATCEESYDRAKRAEELVSGGGYTMIAGASSAALGFTLLGVGYSEAFKTWPEGDHKTSSGTSAMLIAGYVLAPIGIIVLLAGTASLITGHTRLKKWNEELFAPCNADVGAPRYCLVPLAPVEQQ